MASGREARDQQAPWQQPAPRGGVVRSTLLVQEFHQRRSRRQLRRLPSSPLRRPSRPAALTPPIVLLALSRSGLQTLRVNVRRFGQGAGIHTILRA